MLSTWKPVGLVLFISFISMATYASEAFNSGYSILCSEDDCPPSIAAVITRPETTLDSLEPQNILCSGTLIAPNLVLTNRHCFPEALQIVDKDCFSHTEILFPEHKNFSAQKYHCKRIVSVGQSDWLVLEMTKQSLRPTIKPSHQALELNETITGYPINYNPLFPIAEIRKVNCRTEDLGYLDPDLFHPESKEFFATDCSRPIVVGNSGTSFFSSNNSFVGLLNSASHHKYTSPQEVAAKGSTSIRGIKARCIDFFEDTPEICHWDSESYEFKEMAIEYSTLLAFQKRKLQLEKPKSSFIHWEEASVTNVSPFMQNLYPYSQLIKAQQFLTSHQRSDIAHSLTLMAKQIMQWIPTCINSSPLPMIDRMDYQILNFHDSTTYPNENGNSYLGQLDNLQLNPNIELVNIPLEIVFNNSEDLYIVSYKKMNDPFAMSQSELSFYKETCLKEETLKKQTCKKDNCQLSLKELSTASKQCQDLFRRKSLSHYLQKFKFKLPSCNSSL